MKKATDKKLILSTLAMAICSSLNAAEKNNAEEVATKGIDFETIVVTGSVGKGKTVMASSVSVSSMSEDQIEIATPRSSAEAFRNIPGIRAEASGGDGNANLAVRGLPVLLVVLNSCKSKKMDYQYYNLVISLLVTLIFSYV